MRTEKARPALSPWKVQDAHADPPDLLTDGLGLNGLGV